MRRTWVPYVVGGCLAAAVATGAFAAGRPVHLDPMTQKARNALRPQMAGHANNMEELMWAVIMNEPAQTRVLAQGLAHAEVLTQKEHPRLQPRFSELQAALADRALDLSAQAAARDPEGTARAYGRVVETCVACHAKYMDP